MECSKVLRGRMDKKFCDDYCRNSYNNKLNSVSVNHVRNINNALAKNRRILESFIPQDEEMTKAPKDRLLAAGYNFTYCTHLYKNKKGNQYTFCYEFGFMELDNNWLLIVKRNIS